MIFVDCSERSKSPDAGISEWREDKDDLLPPKWARIELSETTPSISKVLPVATPTQAGSLCYTNTVAW